MNQGGAARLLLAVALQSPTMGEGVAEEQPSPHSFSGALQDTDREIHTIVPVGLADVRLEGVYETALAACIAADSTSDISAQIKALDLVWGFVYPNTTWKLNKSSARELLKLAGSAQKVLLYLEEFEGRDDIQWPFGFSKAAIQKKVREEQKADGEITDGIREALRMGAEQGDGYKDFRRYIKGAKEGGKEGTGASE